MPAIGEMLEAIGYESSAEGTPEQLRDHVNAKLSEVKNLVDKVGPRTAVAQSLALARVGRRAGEGGKIELRGLCDSFKRDQHLINANGGYA